MTEGKKHKATPTAARPENTSVGEMLRVARTAKGLEIEEVSSSIHIRPAQLRAIEDNNIEALPGMTYALGFVRSYANFLGLPGAEIIHKFKAEHGHTPSPAKLTFPEPIAESRMPDPIMVGAGAFLAVVVLVLWTVYSNIYGGGVKSAEQIPPAPEVTTTADVPAETAPLPAEVAPVVAATPTPALLPASKDLTAKTDRLPPVKTAVIKPPEEQTAVSDAAPTDEEDATSAEEAPLKSAAPVAASDDAVSQSPVINVKRGKSRIVLTANQASWVQITDANQDVVYRKVLRSGEQYYVQDQPGLSLVTANAGGLDISVDGQSVQSIGKPGEIVRGIILDPKELKVHKIRVRD